MSKYSHVMLKLSGEMLGGDSGSGIDPAALSKIADEIVSVAKTDCKVSVVIGGGNIFRGAVMAKFGMERTSADYMGMLATIINGLALQATVESKGVETRVMTAITMQGLAEPYIRRKALKHLEKGRVVIFAGGTGNPLFTTDTAASLRAREVGAEIILKGTKVDGIYDSDPATNPDAKKFEELSYIEVISKKLKVMDATAVTMCMEAGLPIKVFKLSEPGSVVEAIQNEKTGTIVKPK